MKFHLLCVYYGLNRKRTLRGNSPRSIIYVEGKKTLKAKNINFKNLKAVEIPEKPLSISQLRIRRQQAKFLLSDMNEFRALSDCLLAKIYLALLYSHVFVTLVHQQYCKTNHVDIFRHPSF